MPFRLGATDTSSPRGGTTTGGAAVVFPFVTGATENTQYNPSQLKIHSTIHQTVTVTGADENTWYDSSNSHWYT